MASAMKTSAQWISALMLTCLLSAPAYAQSWRIDRSTFNPSADACSDFYEHVCGGWIDSNPIRTDRSEARWSSDLAEERDRGALTQLLTGRDRARDPELARVRTFFASCMADGAAVESAGWVTLKVWLARMDAIDSRERLMAAVRDLHAAGIPVLFQYSGEPDRNNRTQFRAEIHQSALTLPAPFYSEATPGGPQRWDGYRAHVARMFELTGTTSERAKRDAEAVLRLEAWLASVSLSFPDRFDPRVSEHVMTVEELARLAPHFDWRPYFDLVKYTGERPLNVTSTRYIEQLEKLLADASVEDWRAYLRWQLLNAMGPALPGALAEQYLQFTAGANKARRSRFDECQLATVKAMGVELSRQYSLRFVGKATREQARSVVEHVRETTGSAVLQVPWLSQDARRRTKQKVDELSAKVGYPDNWPTTGTFALRTDAYLDNALAARAFEQQRIWQRVNGARRRDSWEITVYPNAASGMAAARLVIANGYPDTFTNSIVLTAGYLRPPLFDSKAPIEVQYGTFGTMVAHEFVHVLENHQYDHFGETNDLWSPADATAHDARMGCVRDQGNQFLVIDESHLDGSYTADENIADISGVPHTYAALARELGDRIHERGRDGLTRAQRFFVSYAQSWCAAERPEYTRQMLGREAHAPNRFRVNAPLSNMPEFVAAFSCKPDAPMARSGAARCAVW
jgi:putative endopeptidase